MSNHHHGGRRGGGGSDLESGAGASRSRPHKPRFIDAHPVAAAVLLSLSLGLSVLIILSLSAYRGGGVDDDVNNAGLGEEAPGGGGGGVGHPFPGLRNLVMVAGHAVYTSGSCGGAGREGSWFLEPYQRHPGQADTFVAHVRAGVAAAARDGEALLLFSGGETRREAGPRSEAQSYWSVADSMAWFGHDVDASSVRRRALTEEHARDSFENLLFSICRFRQLTGRFPQNITVLSYDFKEERFAQLHRSALSFPEARFHFLGTPAAPAARQAAAEGEASVRSQFRQDPYGCRGSLGRKRVQRDPFRRAVPYPAGCPELKGLFSYCGPAPYPGQLLLPWTPRQDQVRTK